ncbi:hypothetical protein [Legionella sp. PC997]|uniref:hypothetical protein n=1 Tax=Legionella sp. PC997 TaxID=2755562 RepID=UPI0015F79CC5|nr:hypothetical protein [Legionella sp. PC997]QMT62072.1 hypothetical protein HBNCFIEN_03480 [Legionella sp. PC997]
MTHSNWIQRKKRRQESKDQLSTVNNNKSYCMIIHYSCESFYKIVDGHTPRVTSIAIRNFENGQTHSFSIHKSAEEEHIAQDQIENHYDKLERKMLDQYFIFLSNKNSYKFIHWNMRDINFGFQAIEHRYKVLNGEPVIINDLNKIDLARVLIGLYGIKYISHGEHGRLNELLKHNKITMKDILTGEEEADAFEKREFVKLHQSTLRKSDALANILERTLDGTLRTKAKWVDIYGVHPSTIIELIKNHWIYSLLGIIILLGGIYKFWVHYL